MQRQSVHIWIKYIHICTVYRWFQNSANFTFMCVCIHPVPHCLRGSCESAGGQSELEKLQALLSAERSRNQQMTELICSLKQDKELLQHEITKKAELICDFLQDKLRPGRFLPENTAIDETCSRNH